MLLTGPNEQDIVAFKADLHVSFEMSDFEPFAFLFEHTIHTTGLWYCSEAIQVYSEITSEVFFPSL